MRTELPKKWIIKTTKDVIPVLQKTDLSFRNGYKYTLDVYYSSDGYGRFGKNDFSDDYIEIFLQDLLDFLNPEPNYEVY